MIQRFAVVHEAAAVFQIATELADRVLLESVEWLDDELLIHQREWLAEVIPGQRLSWKSIPKYAREIGIRVHGHFDGEPGLPDAAAARRAIHYLLAKDSSITAILLIRDQDDQSERRKGLEQARTVEKSGVVIVIGLSVVERECWVISGFDPLNESESARLSA